MDLTELSRIAELRLGRPDLAGGRCIIPGGATCPGAGDLAADAVMHALGGVAGVEIVVDHRLEALDLAGAAGAGRHAEGVGRHARRGLLRGGGWRRRSRLRLAASKG